MYKQTYEVTITGVTPLLMRQDNLTWAETMKEWQKDPANTGESVSGDDRSPAFTWLGCLYHDNGLVCIPSDNLMTVIREGGAKTPTGKKGATFKRQTQSGLVVDQSGWPLISAKGTIPVKPVYALQEEKSFEKHLAAVREFGFELFVKRAKIGRAKHVRVRPRFDVWSAAGTITVFDEMITTQILQTILTYAGRYSGLCDWRPGAPSSPGPFGKFTAEAKEV